MKRFYLLIFAISMLSADVYGASDCFFAKEGETLISNQGKNCEVRYAPQSTFKIPLSLMGFDSGILYDETAPEWEPPSGYKFYLNTHKGSHNPHEWMRDSVVWYSQTLTQKLGMEQFKGYIEAFNYGNKDISGDKGKNNGLTNSWLFSSLKISPKEQVEFLQKMLQKQLLISDNSYEETKALLYKQEMAAGWKLYGKTGAGDGMGWFVGWIEKDDKKVVFASHVLEDKKQKYLSLKAVCNANSKLFEVIESLE